MYFLRVRDAGYVLVEVAVFLIEALFYRLAFGTRWSRSFVLSLAANLSFVLAGILVRRLVGLR
jgi:hypothetical protein